MRKTVVSILLGLVLALTVLVSSVTLTSADSRLPAGACPTGFTRMTVMEHDKMEHNGMEHKHAGLRADLNGNDYICMAEATGSIHVHMDDVLK